MQHLIQEYCTSWETGIFYNIENKNFVQHGKQEFCTTQKTGILYIADTMRSINRPCVVAVVRVLGSINYKYNYYNYYIIINYVKPGVNLIKRTHTFCTF